MSGRNWDIVRYTPDMRGEWNRLVSEAANAPFLFDRGYMDYHSDRFADHSLLACKGDSIMALLPANVTPDGVLHSHQGLTYGGWIVPRRHIDGADMLAIFTATGEYCKACGIHALDYKPLPHIYAVQPSQDDIYALWRSGAVMTECNLSCTIDISSWPGFNTLQRRHLRKAASLGADIFETRDYGRFWDMLDSCLAERHGASPVHTASELEMLASRFPENIRCFMASADGIPAAGVCVYDTGIVAHCQYIATTAEGRRLNLLTLLMHHLITGVFAARRYFDFGTSNEDSGLYLNTGLLRQKSSLGGSGVAYTRWRMDYR